MKYHITIDQAFWPFRYPEWNTLNADQQRHHMETTLADWNARVNEPDGMVVIGEQFAPYVHVKRLFYSPGVLAIEIERIEQVEKHGHDAAHDDALTDDQLLDAAVALITEDPERWPADLDRKVFGTASEKDTVGRLAVAGAFLAAELDRLLRARQHCSTSEPCPGLPTNPVYR